MCIRDRYKSILLQVTSGCTHNKCKFCGMYRYTNFKMESLDQIEEDVIEASQHPYYRGGKRVFLLNGNPFVLKTERLLKISDIIHKHLPQVEVICMYSSIKDIENKSDQELKMLKDAGINDLYLGIESGNQEALEFINKGNTVEEAITQMKRLDTVSYTHLDQFRKLENKKLREDMNYDEIEGLRLEARQKLNDIKPSSIGQASRISGVSPADISVLLIYLEQKRRANRSEK